MEPGRISAESGGHFDSAERDFELVEPQQTPVAEVFGRPIHCGESISREGKMSEFIYAQRPPLSSSIVGSAICWAVGIGLCAFAVAFAYAGSSTSWMVGLVALSAGAILCGLGQSASAMWKLRLAAVLISSVVGLLFAEGILRAATLHPIHATSNLVPHKHLGYTMDPALPGADANGFCNASVPDEVSIVAIGDSHTQGFGVDPADSWPVKLSEITTSSVYNMGVGGYGPAQYELLIDEALKMRPQHVVVGLYLGNDFADAVRLSLIHI